MEAEKVLKERQQQVSDESRWSRGNIASSSEAMVGGAASNFEDVKCRDVKVFNKREIDEKQFCTSYQQMLVHGVCVQFNQLRNFWQQLAARRRGVFAQLAGLTRQRLTLQSVLKHGPHGSTAHGIIPSLTNLLRTCSLHAQYFGTSPSLSREKGS